MSNNSEIINTIKKELEFIKPENVVNKDAIIKKADEERKYFKELFKPGNTTE